MNTTAIENQEINKIKPNQGSNKGKEDWVECTLGEVCDINMGQSPPSSTYNTDRNGLPFFQGKAEFSELHPIVKKWCSVPKKTANKNDILLSVRAPVGSTNIANQRCAIGRGLAAITYKHNYLFIWFYLKSIESNLDNQGTGTTFKAISGSILKSQKILLPPLPIQRTIVNKIEELFSSLDSGVADLKKAQEQLIIYRQAVLKKAFEGAYTQKTNDLKKVNINGINSQIPTKWSICMLGEVAKLQGGFAFKSAEYTQSGVPIVKISNVHYQDINWEHVSYIDSSRIKEFGPYSLNKDDVLIAMTRPIIKSLNTIKTVIVKASDLPALLNQRVGRFIIGGELDKNFLKYFIFTDFFKNRVLKESSSSQQPNISSTKIEKFDFILPESIQEQHAIVREIESRLSVCDKVEESICESLEKAQALRQSILKKAFEGKLLSNAEIEQCKKEQDYEPASVLLERIKAEKKK